MFSGVTKMQTDDTLWTITSADLWHLKTFSSDSCCERWNHGERIETLHETVNSCWKVNMYFSREVSECLTQVSFINQCGTWLVMFLNAMVTKVRKHSYESIKDWSLKGSNSRKENKSIEKGEPANRRPFHSAVSLQLFHSSSLRSLLSGHWRNSSSHVLIGLFSTTEIIWILVQKF